MPALSPTMEIGSIAKWCLKEGDKFEAGVAICEVETDKATVTFEATDDGILAKILVGSGEVKVGSPLMVTVEDSSAVSAFANFTLGSATAAPAAPAVASAPAPSSSSASPASGAPASSSPAASTASSSGRVVASPFAKKVARESGTSLVGLSGSGPNGRILAQDVLNAPKQVSAPVATAAAVAAPTIASPAPAATTSVKPTPVVSHGVPGVYQDFQLTDLAIQVANRQAYSKQNVPHYYLSVDVDVTKLLALRTQLNADSKDDGVAVVDFFMKAAALAMKQVPDVNGSWMDTFVRRYEQVDINLVMGTGSGLVTPVVRDVSGKGLRTISSELSSVESALASGSAVDGSIMQPGTFSIHNLGLYGIKSAAPIIITPQACALGLGAIVDTVVPNPAAKEGEDNWKVARIVTATLSCDHRVVDGAVGAQWLAAFRLLIENPMTMLL